MENLRLKTIQAIRLAQAERRWRSGSAARHLLKRKVRGNLRIGATLGDYDRVIQAVLLDPGARVYVYWYQGTPYATVVSASDDDLWLVMIDLDGWLARAEKDGRLDDEQRLRLTEADHILLEQAERFYEAIKQIADLEAWRRQEDVPSEHWWWYLDVLAQVPSWSIRDRSHVSA